MEPIRFPSILRPLQRPELINELATLPFGSQCVVVAIDAKQIDGEWKVHLVGGKVPTEINLFDWAKEVEERGAGEILFTSMDHDGTKSWFCEHRPGATFRGTVNLPIIASGGAGETLKHFTDTFHPWQSRCRTWPPVCSTLERSVSPDLKQQLKAQQIAVRL